MTSRNTLDRIDVIRLLNRAVKASGSQSAFAKKAGVSVAYVSAVVNGVKPASDDLLLAAGIKHTVEHFYEILEG